MAPGTDGARSRWTLPLATALAVAVGAAVVASALAAEYLARLNEISPCYGGNGSSSCPPEIGIYVVQLGHGTFVNGSFGYTFLVSPSPPPNPNASSITLRAYNATTNATSSLLNVTLFAPDGSLLATYHTVGGTWITSSTVQISEVDLLTATSLTNLSGEVVSIFAFAGRVGFFIPLT
jgi:hypothetical protein